MPRGDRTGPSGLGPLTGRGAGYCSGSVLPGSASGVGQPYSRLGFFGRAFPRFTGLIGRGLGMGRRGGGRGRRW